MLSIFKRFIIAIVGVLRDATENWQQFGQIPQKRMQCSVVQGWRAFIARVLVNTEKGLDTRIKR